MILKEERKALYDRWVDLGCAFLEEAGPKLDRCCSAMQSRPVLDKSPDVVFFGYNAHETDKFCIDKNRFYTGDPYFYTDGKTNWPVWSKLYGVMKWCSHSMEDDNFVFMNVVFSDLKISLSRRRLREATKRSQNACVSRNGPSRRFLAPNWWFAFQSSRCSTRSQQNSDSGRWKPVNGPKHVSKRAVKRGWWSNCKVIGIPHPSQAISYEDLGAIALFIK